MATLLTRNLDDVFGENNVLEPSHPTRASERALGRVMMAAIISAKAG
jgi:hypothetical protein